MDPGVLGSLEVHLLSRDKEFSGVGDFGACEAFDERGLAGAVVADDGQDFARVEIQADSVQANDPSESLDEVPGLENGLAGIGVGGCKFCHGHDLTFRIH